MEQSLFKELLAQNIQSCSYAFDAITEENSSSRLNENTASVRTMQVKSLLQLSAQPNREQPATPKQLQFFYLHSIT